MMAKFGKMHVGFRLIWMNASHRYKPQQHFSLYKFNQRGGAFLIQGV